jgi:hypothetical protein
LPDATLTTLDEGMPDRAGPPPERSGAPGSSGHPSPRHIRSLFPTRAAALGAGRELLRARLLADVSISAHPDDATLSVVVAEEHEGSALYVMYRWGAELEFDVPLVQD